eukprot:TRINITY_DN6088_c0_g1_i1.p1 TRINITY_DN6088_c0_g1~~TRINITY_DN6088_c0_g1_i1.p1  ORF type:complete len:647 (-),score=89.05 TRINITY_DN6088_c0_g1_i1:193-2133(-)
MSSVSSKTAKGQRGGDLCLRGTFIDVVNNDEPESPRALSDPGSVSTESCSWGYFESENKYVEELSFAWSSHRSDDNADGSSLSDALSNADSSVGQETRMPAFQENRWLLRKQIQKKWDTARKKPGQRGHHAALSAIREIPDGVDAMVKNNANTLIEGIMDGVLEMRDDVYKTLSSFESASADGALAHTRVIETVDELPELIQTRLDVHIAEAHRKLADHVEEVVQGLEGVRLDQGELAKATHAVSEEVQEIIREQVDAAAQESLEYAQRRINKALHFLAGSESVQVTKPTFVHAPVTSGVLRAAHDVVLDTMEHVRHKVVQKDVTSTLANEAVAETLLRAKTAQCEGYVPETPSESPDMSRDMVSCENAKDTMEHVGHNVAQKAVTSTLANEAVADTFMRAQTAQRGGYIAEPLSESPKVSRGLSSFENTNNTMDHVRLNVAQKDVTSTLANEAVADTLMRTKTGQRGGYIAEKPSEAPQVAPNKPSLENTNVCGSVGHPELCARPCIYAASGKCANGATCGFCHLPHDTRPAHLDKKGRDKMKRMPLEERAAMILPIVRQRAIQLGIREEFIREIDHVVHSLGLHAQLSSASNSGRAFRNQCTKFTLRSLFTMLKADGDANRMDLQNALQSLSDNLRRSLVVASA